MSSDEVSFNFSGTNDKELEDYVLAAQKILSGINGITETSTSLSDTTSEVRIHVDKNRASHFGMTTSDINSYVKQVLSGVTASRYNENGSEYDI